MTGRLTALALAALPAAACLSIPPYDPQRKVSYTEDGTGATVSAPTVSAPEFALHFANGDLFHFPDTLKIGTTNVLGNDTSASCSEANGAGIQLSPGFRISGDTVAMTMDPLVKNELQPVLRGPAVVQMRIDWASTMCDAARKPHGTSTFTVFLDGRIVRHDRLEDAVMTDVNPAFCRCPNTTVQSEFNVSSYWTFDRKELSSSPSATVFTGDLFSSQAEAAPRPLPSEINGQVFACFNNDTYQVASALRLADKQEDVRQFLLRDNAALFAPTHFNVLHQPSLAFPWDNRSAVFLEHRGCNAAFDRAREYLADPPPAITINDKTPAILSENDGIYGGDTGDGNAPGVKLTTDQVELKGSVGSPFAVWLQFPHAVDLLRAKLDGATGPWYIPQQVDSRSWIVWFRDPLTDQQTIKIAPD